MAEHTPGPWRHVGTGIEARAFDGSWKWLTPVVRGGSPEQATANRALMAAAPDLLAALRHMVGSVNGGCKIAEAAIAKAEGK